MGARGAFILLTADQHESLRSSQIERTFVERLDAIDRSLQSSDIALMDKAWWGMFCVLPDGMIESDSIDALGVPAEFGTQRIYSNVCGDRYLSLLSPARVRSSSLLWQDVTEESVKQRYFALAEASPRFPGLLGRLCPKKRHWYASYVSLEDIEYVASDFAAAKEFFAAASNSGHAVLFDGSG